MFEGFTKIEKSVREATGTWNTEPCIAITAQGFSINKIATEKLKLDKRVIVHIKDNLIGFEPSTNGEGYAINKPTKNGKALSLTVKRLAKQFAKYNGKAFKLQLLQEGDNVGGLIDLNKEIKRN